MVVILCGCIARGSSHQGSGFVLGAVLTVRRGEMQCRTAGWYILAWGGAPAPGQVPGVSAIHRTNSYVNGCEDGTQHLRQCRPCHVFHSFLSNAPLTCSLRLLVMPRCRDVRSLLVRGAD